jgi:surface antigen
MEKKSLLKHWCARSLMVVGKLFLSTVLVSSLAHAENLPASVTGHAQAYDRDGALRGLFSNRSLPREDQRTHIQAILMALNNTQNGEIVEWSNPYTDNNGQVRVVYTFNTGAGFCRVFQTLLQINGDVLQYQETGCYLMGKNSWEFYNK